MAFTINDFISRLGQSNAPFGFAPPPNGSVAPSQQTPMQDPANQAGWQMVGNIGAGMLARGDMKPGQAFGQSYLDAQGKARDQSKDAMVAQQMMAEAEANRQKQEEERQKRLQMEQAIAQLPPEQQAIARMMPEKFFGEQIEQKFGKSDGVEYGLNPIWAQGPDGQWGLFQPNKAGSAPQQMQFPEGYSPSPPVSFQDLGTTVQPYSTKGGSAVGEPITKDLAGAEAQKEIGTAAGKATAAAPGDIAAADVALEMVNKIRSDPNKAWGTGGSSVFNALPGTPGRDFQNRVDQAKSGAFLTAIQQMRGLGQLSNAEGSAATAAINRLNTATSEQEFDDALNDYEKIVNLGKARAMKRLEGGQPDQGGNTRYRFNPETGELE
jgi:hypothetical protein